MAIAATVLDSSSTTTDTTSYTTASISPAANSLLLVLVGTSNSGTLTAAVATPSGLSLTYTSRVDFGYGSTTNDVRRLQAFTAQCGGSPSIGAITLTMDVTSTHASWVVVEITGHDTTSPVVQAVTNKADTGTVGTVTLAAAADANNRPFSWWGSRAGGTGVTPATSWTELSDATISSPTMIQEAQWRSDAFDTAAAATFTASSNWGGIALEIAVAAAGPTNATVTAVVATGTALARPPVASGGSNVAAVRATATATAPAPVVITSGSGTVIAVRATATALAVAPVVRALAPAVSAVRATATAAARAPAVTGGSTVLIFEPPVYDVQVEPERLIKRPRYQLTQSMSVVRINGTLTSFKSPSDDMLATAGAPGTDYFLGGHVYTVSSTTAAELIAAGYTVTQRTA